MPAYVKQRVLSTKVKQWLKQDHFVLRAGWWGTRMERTEKKEATERTQGNARQGRESTRVRAGRGGVRREQMWDILSRGRWKHVLYERRRRVKTPFVLGLSSCKRRPIMTERSTTTWGRSRLGWGWNQEVRFPSTTKKASPHNTVP